jgi:hypothetical protein
MVSAVVLDRSVATQVVAMADAWTRRMVEDGLDESTALAIRSVLDGMVLLCLLHAPQPNSTILLGSPPVRCCTWSLSVA